MESEIKIDDINIFFSRENNFNERPVIIFLHESLGCTELWKNFPAMLGEKTKCNFLVYDRQGHGRSDPFSSAKRNNEYMETEADILIKLMKLCEINNAILFGHSDGGTIALLAASKYPSNISGVITEGAHVFVENVTLSGIKRTVESFHSTDLKEKLIKYHGDKTETLFSAWTETWLSDEFRNWNIEHLLSAVQCPVLIIQGENDEYGSIKQTEAIANQVSGPSFKFIIPNTGHSPHKESLEQTLVRSAEFINNLNNK